MEPVGFGEMPRDGLFVDHEFMAEVECAAGIEDADEAGCAFLDEAEQPGKGP